MRPPTINQMMKFMYYLQKVQDQARANPRRQRHSYLSAFVQLTRVGSTFSATPSPASPPASAPTAAPTTVPIGPATLPAAAPAAIPPAAAPTPVPTGWAPGVPVIGSRFSEPPVMRVSEVVVTPAMPALVA